MPTFTYRTPNGADEAVEAEAWSWTARYADGTTVAQFDARDGTFHRFDEIDLGRIAELEVRPARGPGCAFRVHVVPGMRPIFFKRHRRLHVGTPHERHEVLYCFGYQETVGGRNVKCVLTVGADGAVSIRNHDGRPE